MGVGRIFSRGGGTSGFFIKLFLGRGAQGGAIWVLSVETKKIAFFAETSKFVPSIQHLCLCVGLSSCHTIKNWCNFKRFNTILNSESFLNLIRIKYLTDQLNCVFAFALVTLNINIIFLQ